MIYISPFDRVMNKILLIEDDPSIVFCITTILEDDGYKVQHTLDADEIRDLVPLVDLVVCDYYFGIPDMPFESVRDLCVKHGKPIILQSSIREKIHTHQIFKPYTSETLLDMVASLINIQ